MKKIIAILLISSITGCAWLPGWNSERGITIHKKSEERTRLNLPDPDPIKPSVPTWIVITPENQNRIWAELKEKNIDMVLFGLTDDGYEELSIDTAKTRNFIAQQRELLKKYREYYEPKPTDSKQP